MNRDDIIRTAGILEGEGSFFNDTGKYSPVVACHMTDKDVIEYLKETWGGYLQETKRQKEHHKPAWRWTAKGSTAVKVMEAIKPFMFSRRSAKIDEVMSIWENRPKAAFDAKAHQAALDYLDGLGSYRELEKKYGVNRTSIQRRVWQID